MVSKAGIDSKPIVFEGPGLTSKKNIKVQIERLEQGQGINFILKDLLESGGGTSDSEELVLKAHACNVVNTLRNVTLGTAKQRLCLVEHILAAIAVWGLADLRIEVYGPEIPLGDGSALFWLELFESSGWQKENIISDLQISEPIICKSADRLLMAIPDEQFSVDYMIDWNHPLIGKTWQSWTASQSPKDILAARTFGSMHEHQMLGIADKVVSMTESGFTDELRYKDEPVRHKLLDLVGDLFLAGVNPLRWQARFISIKGGHQLDVEMAKKLSQLVIS